MHPLPPSDHHLLRQHGQTKEQGKGSAPPGQERDLTRAVFSSAAARKRAASLARSLDSRPRLQVLPAQQAGVVDASAEVQES